MRSKAKDLGFFNDFYFLQLSRFFNLMIWNLNLIIIHHPPFILYEIDNPASSEFTYTPDGAEISAH